MYDVVTIDDLAVKVRRVTGLGSPAPRRDVTHKAARHGAVDRTLWYEGRVVGLEGIIAEATPAASWAAFDALKGTLALGSTHTLKLLRRGMTDQEQMAVVVASPVDDSWGVDDHEVIRWGVSLHAPDPRIYGAVLRSGSYDPAASTGAGGASLPLTLPIVFSTSTASHLELVNGGNVAAPPVLTVRGPIVNPIVDNDTLGDSVGLVYPLGASETIEVDVAARTVKLNGAERLDLLDVPNTTWWELAPGSNRLRLRGSGVAVGQTLLTCRYRDARI
jgi:hypothetical protein